MRTTALIRIDIVIETPGGVTAPEMGSTVDLPLRRDRDGAVWVPPTSLTGSLRAHFGGHAQQFFGSPPPQAEEGGRLQPSPVRVLGSTTVLPARTEPEERSSTAIDPRRAAAAPSTLRSRELLPVGTAISLFLRYDRHHTPRTAIRDTPADTPAETDEPYDLGAFIDTAAAWRPCIGRGRTTGAGRARVTRIAARSVDLRDPAQLRSWLHGDRHSLFPDGDNGWDRVVRPEPAAADAELRLDLVTVDALHIGAGHEGTSGEATRVLRSGGDPIVPGSTWKGLLRARCGYILRSCGVDACLVVGGSACQTCALCATFGWTGPGGTAGRSIGRAGSLVFHDSRVDGTLGRRNHIGIDRFTGGVRSGLLFADEVVADGTFSLTVTARDGRPVPAAVRGLLLLALRDLDSGLVGIGRATTRGYGTVRLTDGSRAVLAELEPGHPTGDAVRALLTGKAAA